MQVYNSLYVGINAKEEVELLRYLSPAEFENWKGLSTAYKIEDGVLYWKILQCTKPWIQAGKLFRRTWHGCNVELDSLTLPPRKNMFSRGRSITSLPNI